jgi:hypothetical protein
MAYMLTAHWEDDNGVHGMGCGPFETMHAADTHRHYMHNPPPVPVVIKPVCDGCGSIGEPNDWFCAYCGEVMLPTAPFGA